MKAAICECTDPDCKKNALSHCPIVRMGKVNSNTAFVNNMVIPQNQCIGCGICAVKCRHGKIKLIDW